MKRLWIWGGLSAMISAFALGLALVWVNIEMVDLSYNIKKLQRNLEEKKGLKAKLEVERNRLIAPYNLRQMAQEYELHPAEPRQVRSLPR